MEVYEQGSNSDDTVSRYLEVPAELSMNAIESEQHAQIDLDSETDSLHSDDSRRTILPVAEPTSQKNASLPAEGRDDRHIAVYTRDGLERLLARQIFFAFMRSIQAMNVEWEEDFSEVTAENDDSGWQGLKVSNKKLCRLVSSVCETSFLSLEEGYFDVIAPLSLNKALPGNYAVLDYIHRQASQCITERKLSQLPDVLTTLSRLAMAFDNNANDFMIRAIAIFQYYLDFAAFIGAGLQMESRGYTPDTPETIDISAKLDISDMRRYLAKPLEDMKATAISKICSVFEGQFSMWLNPPTTNPPEVVITSEENNEAFGLTELHVWVLKRSSSAPPSGNELNWLKKDAFGWTPIHYLATVRQHLDDIDWRPKEHLRGVPWQLEEHGEGVHWQLEEHGGGVPWQLEEHGGGVPWQLETAIEANSQDQFGLTPLYYACASANVEMVKLLLDNGASTRIQQSNGISPLHIAAL